MRGLKRELEKLGVRRSLNAVQKWAKHPEWKWGRPAPGNPVDPHEVQQWAEERPSGGNGPSGSALPPTDPQITGEQDPDPWSPPSDAQIIWLRDNYPQQWAEFFRKLEAARKERFDREREQGKYVLASEARQQRVAQAAAVQTGLRRTARSLSQTLADIDDPAQVEEVLRGAFRSICNNAFGADAGDFDNADD